MEYEDYKERQEKWSKGLGDDIAKIASTLKADKVATVIANALGFDSCGCDERKETLNKIFAYDNPECLTEDEFVYLKRWFDRDLMRPDPEETDIRNRLFDIHNRVFKTDKPYTNCGSCIIEVVENLRKLINVY